MYKCGRCGKIVETLPEDGIVRCPACAHKILYKQRQPVTKTIKAR